MPFSAFLVILRNFVYDRNIRKAGGPGFGAAGFFILNDWETGDKYASCHCA